jgi:U1 small nuclear ribonucleoprotein
MSAQGLPAHILALFTPRPPPQHLPPQARKSGAPITGCAEYVEFFSTDKPPPPEMWESPLEKKLSRNHIKMEAHKEELKETIAKYDPHKDTSASGDPFKTLFTARISYDTTEKKLKREFEVFGSIKKVRMVYDQKGKPRGYAFIEYEHERDLKNAYKQGDGKKIDGRRVMVDVERGRTVEGWLPRRLGGGRGPGRVGKPSKKKAKKAKALQKAKEQEEKEKAKEGKGEDKDKKRGRSRSRDKDKKRGRSSDKKRDRSRSRDDRKRR